jgi:hypothetical protein
MCSLYDDVGVSTLVNMQTLSALQDRLPPFPNQQAMAVIEAEVGPTSEIFSYLSPEPIAAASLGQVPPPPSHLRQTQKAHKCPMAVYCHTSYISR